MMFLLIIPFASDLLSEMSKISSCFSACFINAATISLPIIPLWAGTHIKVFQIFIFLNLYSVSHISLIISYLLWDVNDCNDINAEHESVQRITFLIGSSFIHCNAVAIAIISTVTNDLMLFF